jgi:hypothetical protein
LRALFLVSFFVLLYSCSNKKTENSKLKKTFYYWQQQYKLDNLEQRLLEPTDTLYCKFFDVVSEQKVPKPVAIINFKQAVTNPIVPTVFLTNECFLVKDSVAIASLAQNTTKLIFSIAQKHKINISEIQFDCDWTRSTAKAYFRFLKQVKALSSAKRVSCTIRLHQIKFPERMGIPPVDKGVLMCYNMGQWKTFSETNSIFNANTLEQYTERLRDYPLPLDLALPLFFWNLWYRNNTFKGILTSNKSLTNFLTNNTEKRSENIYQIEKDTLLGSRQFLTGDLVKNENVSLQEIAAAQNYLTKKWPNKSFKIIYFDLNSKNLSQHNYDQLTELLKN